MRLRLAALRVYLRLLIQVASEVPGFIRERMDEFVRREQAVDTLEAVCGKDAASVYLYATRGDPHAALVIAQTGFDPLRALDLRDQGFSPESVQVFAEIWATTPEAQQ
jgi:hypothetical protein